jgi:hypothetical protein
MLKRLLKLDCRTCIRRPTCQSLCPAAEAYTNQDYRSGREKLVGDIVFSGNPWPDFAPSTLPKLSHRQLAIFTLISAGIARQIVSKTLKLTHIQMNESLYRIRRKIREIDTQ